MSFFSYRRGDRDGDVCVSGACVREKRDVRVRCFREFRAIGLVLNRSRERVWNGVSWVGGAKWGVNSCPSLLDFVEQEPTKEKRGLILPRQT